MHAHTIATYTVTMHMHILAQTHSNTLHMHMHTSTYIHMHTCTAHRSLQILMLPHTRPKKFFFISILCNEKQILHEWPQLVDRSIQNSTNYV